MAKQNKPEEVKAEDPAESAEEEVTMSPGIKVNVTRFQPGDAVILEIMRKTGRKEFYLVPQYKLYQFENAIYEWNESENYLYTIQIKAGAKLKEYPANRYYEGNPKAQPERAGLYPSAYFYTNAEDGKKYILDGRALMQRLELSAWDIKEWKEGSKERLVTDINMKWIVIAIVVVVVAVIAAFVMQGKI
jgi:hypothetical protein